MSKMIDFNRLKDVFFIFPKSKKVYFVRIHGDWSIPFPVVDGKIANKTERVGFSPYEKVKALEKSDWPEHGITDKTIEIFIKPSERLSLNA